MSRIPFIGLSLSFFALAFAGAAENSIGLKLVRIEPGSFLMGQDGPVSDYQMNKHPEEDGTSDFDEKPAHRVTISTAFEIGATEVTLGQYRQFRPEHGGGRGGDDEAVTNVSWFDAVAFCEWLSRKEGCIYRLPTEAEWEYACRAGTTTAFHTGDHLPDGFQKWRFSDGRLARYFKDGKPSREYRDWPKREPLRVAQTPPNAWGLSDMHGNVGEWCADWHGPYEAGAQTDPLGRAKGDFRVIRGGWHSTFARLLRSANRSGWLPGAKNEFVGFRVVRGPMPTGSLLPPALPPANAANVSQALFKIQAVSSTVPFFAGPKPFVDIALGSNGPLYSWHNHSPSITECPNGDLLAVWYSTVDEGGSELCNVASRLRLGAEAWEPASPFWDGPDVNDHAPKIWWDGDETLFHFARGWNENIVRTSTDNGATWSEARMIQPVGEFGNDVLRLKDGTIILGNDNRQCSLVWSKDHGSTWAFHDVAQRASDWRSGGSGVRYPGIHAPMVELGDGRILAFSRLDKPEDQERFGVMTPASFTADRGRTWSFEASPFPAISSVQRQAMIRLREGPILFCTYTDQRRDWEKRKGLAFRAADGSEFRGYGLFAALSEDDGRTWAHRRLITPGGKAREEASIDRNRFTVSDTMAESAGYLSATQTRDGMIQLISSKNHYQFNLAWLRQAPPSPAR